MMTFPDPGELADLDQFFTRDSDYVKELIGQVKQLLTLHDPTVVWSICGQIIARDLISGQVSAVQLSSLLSIALVQLAEKDKNNDRTNQ